MYLITKEQYEEIRDMEGRGWYSKEVKITTDELNIPVLTITGEEKYLVIQPSKEYLEVIGAGLKDRYQLSNEEITQYLHNPYSNTSYNKDNIKEILENK